MTTKRTLRRQLADAQAQIRRLADDRADAREDADTGTANTGRLCRQLDALREENTLLRRRLRAAAETAPPASWRRERSRLVRELDLSQRARAALDAQVRELGAANDHLSREAYDQATGVTRA